MNGKIAGTPDEESKSTKSDSRWADGSGLPSIVEAGDPRLRNIAEEYKNISELQPLCERLVSMLRDFNGAGLAASQIGESAPVVVVEVRKTDLFPDRPTSPLYIMINPRILDSSGPVEQGWEGCFSIPGIMAKVPRPEKVQVSYTDPQGTDHTQWFEGYLARVVMHEIDHLNGILFTDLMDPKTLTTVSNWKKYHLNQNS
ncbi:MAG: peptide deformylase [Bdellovibrionales bacterium]|nr:peptide deformylase [Bdellovibrionales bacterium]